MSLLKTFSFFLIIFSTMAFSQNGSGGMSLYQNHLAACPFTNDSDKFANNDHRNEVFEEAIQSIRDRLSSAENDSGKKCKREVGNWLKGILKDNFNAEYNENCVEDGNCSTDVANGIQALFSDLQSKLPNNTHRRDELYRFAQQNNFSKFNGNKITCSSYHSWIDQYFQEIKHGIEVNRSNGFNNSEIRDYFNSQGQFVRFNEVNLAGCFVSDDTSQDQIDSCFKGQAAKMFEAFTLKCRGNLKLAGEFNERERDVNNLAQRLAVFMSRLKSTGTNKCLQNPAIMAVGDIIGKRVLGFINGVVGSQVTALTGLGVTTVIKLIKDLKKNKKDKALVSLLDRLNSVGNQNDKLNQTRPLLCHLYATKLDTCKREVLSDQLSSIETCPSVALPIEDSNVIDSIDNILVELEFKNVDNFGYADIDDYYSQLVGSFSEKKDKLKEILSDYPTRQCEGAGLNSPSCISETFKNIDEIYKDVLDLSQGDVDQKDKIAESKIKFIKNYKSFLNKLSEGSDLPASQMIENVLLRLNNPLEGIEVHAKPRILSIQNLTIFDDYYDRPETTIEDGESILDYTKIAINNQAEIDRSHQFSVLLSDNSNELGIDDTKKHIRNKYICYMACMENGDHLCQNIESVKNYSDYSNFNNLDHVNTSTTGGETMDCSPYVGNLYPSDIKNMIYACLLLETSNKNKQTDFNTDCEKIKTKLDHSEHHICSLGARSKVDNIINEHFLRKSRKKVRVPQTSQEDSN